MVSIIKNDFCKPVDFAADVYMFRFRIVGKSLFDSVVERLAQIIFLG